MSDFNINPNKIRPELLSAILAKLTIGNPAQADELNKLLDTLPTTKQELITQSLLAFDSNIDLNNLGNPESKRMDVDRFILHMAAEALLPQPSIDWIVKPLFSPGTVSLVVGDPGSKKTYTLLDLAVCLALGKPWLQFETKQVPVLLIDEESGVRRINRRIGDIMRGHNASSTIPLQYTSLARFNFRPIGSMDISDQIMLETIIRETKAKFVIIDALADVMPGADENSVKDVQPIFMALRQIADHTESAIVIIHHSNRGGGYRGSSAMHGAVDLLLKVKSRPDSPNVDFAVEKNRDDKPITFAAVAHFEIEDKFTLSSSQIILKQELGKPQKFVLDYLFDHGPSDVTNITSHADVCSENSARQAIYDLASLEMIRRVDGGLKGQPATYDLTDKGKEKQKSFK